MTQSQLLGTRDLDRGERLETFGVKRLDTLSLLLWKDQLEGPISTSRLRFYTCTYETF